MTDDNDAVTLTERQLQILRMFAQGYAYKEIAEELGVSPGTIQAVRTAVVGKLAAANITHAVAKAIKLELIKV